MPEPCLQFLPLLLRERRFRIEKIHHRDIARPSRSDRVDIFRDPGFIHESVAKLRGDRLRAVEGAPERTRRRGEGPRGAPLRGGGEKPGTRVL